MRKDFLILIVILLSAMALPSCSHFGLKHSPPESQKPSDSGADRSSIAADTSQVVDDLSITGQEMLAIYDSAAAVDSASEGDDDYVWRKLAVSEEYCTMGIMANREMAWEEAEYYFEKGLAILSELDFDVDSDSLSPEAAKYNRVLAEIATNYRSTLVSLGRLPGDVSADMLISRFYELSSPKLDSLELKRLEAYAEEKVSYNVPIVFNDRVKSCIVYYQTVARDAFERYLTRSTKYIPMIIKILQEYGLPTDLAYLAMVESGFNPHAYSYARAMGMWQFIASTGRLYNLDRTWWYDERKDPEKATHGAARFLKDLYDEFGSWELALAAYNGGPGRVRSVTRQQKTNDFWKLRLKKQTMDYVPFFMAATMICKNPEKFGFGGIDYEKEWKFEKVRINKSLELSTIASALNCPVSKLQELNPELLRSFTPPNVEHYNLRIPEGTRETFLAKYDEMPSAKQTSWVQHKVLKGETLSSIARKYGVSQYAIMEANKLGRKAKLSSGKMLVIPVGGESGGSGYAKKGSRKYQDDSGVYVVRSGDTVTDIARAFGTSPENVRRWNSLDRKARIFVGQRLKIRGDGSSPAEIPDTKETRGDRTVYTVRSGDTIWDIAKKFNTSPAAILKLNNLGRGARIYPGQRLLISAREKKSEYDIYTVRKGDTIKRIASLFNTSVDRIISWNDLSNPNSIQTGTKLRIYND